MDRGQQRGEWTLFLFLMPGNTFWSNWLSILSRFTFFADSPDLLGAHGKALMPCITFKWLYLNLYYYLAYDPGQITRTLWFPISHLLI